MPIKYDITGKKFNKLTAINFVERKGGNYYWLFKCSCGKEKVICRSLVINGTQKTCGCAKEEFYERLRNADSEDINCWKGDAAGYHAKHKYLSKHYPKKGVCENCGKKRKTEYALITGKEYSRKREDYLELCCLCHKRYDFCGLEIKKTHEQIITGSDPAN